MKVVNSRHWDSKDTGRQVNKRIAFIDTRQFERGDGIGCTKRAVPLDVEVDAFRFNVQVSYKILENYNRNRRKMLNVKEKV